jgi:hypothetical protein
MKAYTESYSLTYVTTLKLQLVSWALVGLTAAKFNPLLLLAQFQLHLDLHDLGLLLPVS